MVVRVTTRRSIMCRAEAAMVTVTNSIRRPITINFRIIVIIHHYLSLQIGILSTVIVVHLLCVVLPDIYYVLSNMADTFCLVLVYQYQLF